LACLLIPCGYALQDGFCPIEPHKDAALPGSRVTFGAMLSGEIKPETL
jgi:hypothetical protein